MKHTPGPWKTEVCGTFKHLTRKTGAFSITAGEKLICQFPWARTTGQMVEESEANARLIAAAPDMLEALENIENDDAHMPATVWDLIQKAIAKAKEESR